MVRSCETHTVNQFWENTDYFAVSILHHISIKPVLICVSQNP